MLDKQELFILISKALKIPKKKINLNLKVGDIEEWDSLGQLEILIKIDKQTKGKAGKIKNLSECESVKKIYECLKKNKLLK
tara:strand:+ start:997 stop:1239 length:243 start_codon:yes stop_codon:yes gene_type:complete